MADEAIVTTHLQTDARFQLKQDGSDPKMTPAPNGRSLSEAVDEVARELQVRLRCFPKWISEGRLSGSDANDRMQRQEAALHYLKELQTTE